MRRLGRSIRLGKSGFTYYRVTQKARASLPNSDRRQLPPGGGREAGRATKNAPHEALESGEPLPLIFVGRYFESLGFARTDLCRGKLICFGSQLIFFGPAGKIRMLRIQTLTRVGPQIFIGCTNS